MLERVMRKYGCYGVNGKADYEQRMAAGRLWKTRRCKADQGAFEKTGGAISAAKWLSQKTAITYN